MIHERCGGTFETGEKIMRISKATQAAVAGSILVAAVTGAQAQPDPKFTGARFDINRDRAKASDIGRCAKAQPFLVPTLYLYTSARVKVSAGGGLNNASAKARVYVDLPEKPELQRMAGVFQDQIVGQLRAAGYQVLTWDDIKGDVTDKARMKINPRYGMPTKDFRNFPGVDFVVATPSDDQALDYGMFGPTRNFDKATARTGATQLVTEVYLIAPDMSASASKSQGLTYKNSSAKINYLPSLHIGAIMMYGITAKGAWCSLGVQEMGWRPLALPAGEIRQVSRDTTSYGDWATLSSDYTFVVDEPAMRIGVDAAARSLGRLVTDTMQGRK